MRYLFLFTLLIVSSISIAQNKDDYFKKANDAYDKEDFQDAVIQINKALRYDSTNLDYLLVKANSLFRLKRYEAGFAEYSIAIKLYPKSAVALNQRGLLLRTIQEFEYSIQDFDRALEIEHIDSLKISLLINRGASKIGLRNFQGAYDDFMTAYKIDSTNIGTLNNLATVCDEVGKGDETLRYLFKILAIDSSFVGTYVNIGFKYQEDGNYKKAVDYFTKAISLEPEEPLAYSNRSFNRMKMGDLKGALTDVNRSIELYPANSYAFRNRAMIYIAMKDIGKACTDLDKAIELGYTKMYGTDVDKLKEKYCTKTSL